MTAAEALLREAIAADALYLPAYLNLAGVHRARAQLAAALAVLEQVLKIDPRHFLALLMKGTLLDRPGQEKPAALAYGVALSQAPPDVQLDPATRQALLRARQLNQSYVSELNAFIRQKLDAATAPVSSPEAVRISLFIDAVLGRRKIYRQEPTDYHYPGLPAIEFHEREAFDWLPGFEAATGAIQQELAQVMRSDEGMTPYISYPDNVPLDQWADLNHSLRWSAFHFFHFGRPYPDNCARCPQTMAALSALPQPQVGGRMPAAMFSVLKPRTRIPPHTGVANIRLVVHLPLIVPEGCGFRVGNQTRPWRVGEAFVFDDTIEHEAWNDSDEVRVVLIADLWNPRLSAVEQALIAQMMTAMDEFNGAPTPLPL